VALLAWGNRHFPPEGPSVILVNRKNRRAAVNPILADPVTGRSVDEPDYALAAGPAVGRRTR
jgi:hypothetical protein